MHILKILEAEQEKRRRLKNTPVQEILAGELLKLTRLPLADAMAQAGKLQAMAVKIKGDERALEEFRWYYILRLDKGGKVVTPATEICARAFPQLVPYLGILYPQLEKLVAMFRAAKREGRALTVGEVINEMGQSSRP